MEDVTKLSSEDLIKLTRAAVAELTDRAIEANNMRLIVMGTDNEEE